MKALLWRNVFRVAWPIALTPGRPLPPFGELVVTYRGGGRAPARVPLR